MTFLDWLSILLLYLKMSGKQPHLTWQACFMPVIASYVSGIVVAIFTLFYVGGWLW
jgi:hypothetical protein